MKKIFYRNTVMHTIPFYDFDEESGLIKIDKNTFSLSLKISDINYQISRQDDQLEIFEKYCKVLNSFNEEISAEITVNNKPFDLGLMEENIKFKSKEDGLDEYREEYNEIIEQRLREGKGNIKKEIYITFSVKAKNYKEALAKLDNVAKETIKSLKTLGSKAEIMEVKERLEILHDFYNSNNIGEFKYYSKECKKRGVDSKVLIAPDSFEFKSNYFKLGNIYARSLFLKILPTSIDDNFIDELLKTNLKMLISMHLKSVDKMAADDMLRKQKSNLETEVVEHKKKARKNGFSEAVIPDQLEQALKGCEELLADIRTNNERLFHTSLSIVVLAKDKNELEHNTELIKSIFGQFGCKLGILTYQQEEGLNTTLPIGKKEIFIDRLLTTSASAIFLPFGTQELIQKGGVFYGKNSSSGNALLFSRKNLHAGHGFILGQTGSGKSFQLKCEILFNVLNNSDEIVVLDPQGEYGDFIRALGGEVVKLSPTSNTHINPFDISNEYGGNDGYDALLQKSEFILSMFNNILGGVTGLTPIEKSILDRCTRLVYKPYYQNNKDEMKIPILEDFRKVLTQQEEKEAKLLATSLEIYSKGLLSVFAHKTNVNINNRIVCFDIRDLGEELKGLGFIVVLDTIWNRLCKNKDKKKYTHIYADEFHLIADNKYAANYFVKLYKRARSFGGILTSSTQQVTDVLKNDELATTLSNSEFIMLLNQGSIERQKLAELLRISVTQLSYITNAANACGLIIINETAVIPFDNTFNKKTKLYKLMSTRVKEHNEEAS